MSRLDDTRQGGTMEELGERECWDLLAAKFVGRIAYLGAAGPLILPVNYAINDDTVLFRTAPYNSLAAAMRDTAVAFEVDDIDEYLQSGWSVLIQGHATYVDEDEDLTHQRFNRPEPWAAGVRTLYIRITPRAITGRRLHPA